MAGDALGHDLTTTRATAIRRRRRSTAAPGARPGRTGPGRTWSRVIGPGRVLGGGAASSSRTGVSVRASAGREQWRPSRDQLELIASLLDAGVRLDAALATFERTTTDAATARAVGTVAQAIRRGHELGRALERVGASAHVTALAHAGERTGRLADALRAAGELSGRLEELRATMRRAATYPAVVLLVGLAMVTVISVTVVPQLERTFLDLDGELPTPTRVVLGVSAVVRSIWTPVLAGILLVLRRPIGRMLGRLPLAGLTARVPIVAGLRRDLGVAVLSRMVAAMLDAGIALADVLRSAAPTMEDPALRQRVAKAAEAVARGGSALDADALGSLLDPFEYEVLAVGERTGLVAEQWRRVAERRGASLSDRVVRVGAVMEPLLVVVVGGLVGGAVLALYLPTFRVLDLL
jgi:type II secretory pathway component PulF